MPLNAVSAAEVKSSLESRVDSAWPVALWRDVHVVVAVSGGSDSVALCRCLDALRRGAGGAGRLIVAHFDHRARDDSADDAEWVRELGGRLGLDCEIGASASTGPRSEDRLRAERREFLDGVVRKTGARYLATGHTADDQVETVLFRLFRGSGLAGIAGVAAVSPLSDAASVVRPLLGITRGELVAYLNAIEQPYRTDPSNASTEPTRNWIRHELLPLVESRFGGARDAVLRLAEQSAETRAIIEPLADGLLLRALVGQPSGSGMEFVAVELAAAEPALAVEAIRLAWRRAGWPEQAMTARHWRGVLAVARGEQTAAPLPGDREARRVGDRLAVGPAGAAGA